MKTYGKETQKGRVILTMIKMGADNWYEDYQIEHYKGIWNTNNVGARLSQLLKDGVLEVQYYKNPIKGYPRAKYKLKEEAQEFYKMLYKEDNLITKIKLGIGMINSLITNRN